VKGEIYTVGIVGRPNVGKSCLFNCLLRRNRSIVLDMPGTTMDEIGEKVRWQDRDLFLVDTQGIFEEGDHPVIDRALARADALLLVVDAKSGLTPFDRWIASELKASRIPTLLVINKVENNEGMALAEFSELGFEAMTEVSAAHKRNLSSIEDWCVKTLPKSAPPEAKDIVKVALVGKPNAGKSTLMNRFCKASVSRVSPTALTTRDPVSQEVETRQGLIRFVDTAGMRRPNAKKAPVEAFSVKATERAIEDADVVLLCIASHEDVTDQDMRLLSLVDREGKPTVILLNFWDKLDRESQAKFMRNSEFFRVLKKFPLLKISGKTGFNLSKILPLAVRLHRQASRRVPTAKLNKAIEQMVRRNPPPAIGRGNFNILYASQVAVAPPTFVFFMNRKEALPMSYRRYMENSLKEAFDLAGQPVRLLFRSREDR
jgi:GTPase